MNEQTETVRLRFGYNRGLPAGTDTAWGCRAIVDQGGTVDVVWDRTDLVGPRRADLSAHLDVTVFERWMAKVRQLLANGELSTREDMEVALLDDGVIVVKANPLKSAGYLYVCAYFKRA